MISSQDEMAQKMYHMFDLTVLENNIWYFENVLSYPEELLGFINELDLLEKSYNSITKWEDWISSNKSDHIYGLSKIIKTSNLSQTSGDERLDQKIKYISNSFIMAAEMCFVKYMDGHGLNKDDYNLDLNLIPIRKWNIGEGMGPHCDNQDGHKGLSFSIVTYLNDDYEGGEIYFSEHGIDLKPKAGSLIMFPSVEPYKHGVSNIKSGSRFMSPISVYKK